MKRTAAAFVLLASLGGGCMTTDKKSDPGHAGPPMAMKPANYMGPHGEPITPVAARGQSPGVVRADAKNMPKEGVIPASGFGYMDEVGLTAKGGFVPGGKDGTPGWYPGRGVLPVPAMGPYGAVAAVGALPPIGLTAPINARTSIRFSDPPDM